MLTTFHADLMVFDPVKKTINFSGKQFQLMLYYVCPQCQEPIAVYWKIDPNGPRLDKIQALSPFGGEEAKEFVFFQSESGQGIKFEDRKEQWTSRHSHNTGSYSAKDKVFESFSTELNIFRFIDDQLGGYKWLPEEQEKTFQAIKAVFLREFPKTKESKFFGDLTGTRNGKMILSSGKDTHGYGGYTTYGHQNWLVEILKAEDDAKGSELLNTWTGKIEEEKEE
jgi:hypothetical protein